HLEISERDFSGTPHNVLQLGAGISASSVTVTAASSGALVLTDGVSGDQITLDGMLNNSVDGVQQVQFADGTVWTAAQVDAMARQITGTTGNDTLAGTSGADFIDGKGGNDYESGGGGGDTFVFNTGYGHLEINESDSSTVPHNVLQLGAGIAESSLTVSSNGMNVVLTDGISGDQITLDNALTNNDYGVQLMQFADGTAWTAAQVDTMARQITGTRGNDTLVGTGGADFIDGKGGNDYESGG
ncbi:calcium-binding protein, partial [Paraburkholderia sediminicola]|uniref:calcium-binding protein n=1 Tax=Paraburkholderia sediminicola TaxID=458836 RepID=UPI0038B996E1